MSGRKTVTVDSSELQRLQRDASQLRALRRDLPDKIMKDIKAVHRSMGRQMEAIEYRQRTYEQKLNGLNENIRVVERGLSQRIVNHTRETLEALQKTTNRLEEQRNELRSELHATAQQLSANTHQVEKRLNEKIHATEERLSQIDKDLRHEMALQEQQLSEKINHEKQEREKALKEVNARVNQIQNDKARIANDAMERIRAAEVIRDFIKDNYHHKLFAPGEIAKLDRIIQASNGMINNNAPEAALAESERAYQVASNLRVELEKLENEWGLWREQALVETTRLLAEAQENRKVAGVEVEGEIVEVNFWTEDKLSRLEEKLNSIKRQSENEEDPRTIEDLRKLVEETLPELDCELDKIIEEAQIKVISSQVRTNIADLAIRALKESGYELVDHTFECDDMRGSFVCKSMNHSGSEVVISVIPDGDTNEMMIESIPAEGASFSEEEVIERNKELANSMRKKGLQVSEPQTISRQPSLENRDIEEVRNRKSKKLTSQRSSTAGS